MNNREFAEQDQNFRGACEAAGVKPTMRQASKFRRKTGSAFVIGLPKLRQATTGAIDE